MRRLLMLLLLWALTMAAAGCGSSGPGAGDIFGDSGADAFDDTAPADPGGQGDTVVDIHRDQTSEAGDETSADVGGETGEELPAADTEDSADPGDETDVGMDVPDDGPDAADLPDSADAVDDVPNVDSVEDVTPSDNGGDIRDAVVTDTTEPASLIPVFSGFSAAAGSSASQGHVLGFSIGAGHFEFSAAGGNFILGPSTCVVK